MHEITCTVSDGRFSVSDTVEISVVNDAPFVEILTPVGGDRFPAGVAIWAEARVGDVNGNLERVYWQIFNGANLFPTGWTGRDRRSRFLVIISRLAGTHWSLRPTTPRASAPRIE